MLPTTTETTDDVIKDISKQLEATARDLRKVGIKVEMMGTNRHGVDQFQVRLELDYNRERLRIALWAPQEPRALPRPKLTVVAASASHHQAVLSLVEDARTLVETVEISQNKGDETPSREDIIRNFPVGLPTSAKYTVKNLGKVESEGQPERVQHRFTVTAKVPASTMTFLVGRDERHLFISALPKPAKSVEEAHKILMPKEVAGKRGVLRQGEWFFIPATDEEKAKLALNTVEFVDSIEGSDHEVGSTASIPPKRKGGPVRTLVAGVVSNERHKHLVLNGWYRVVRNTELESQSNSWD